MRKQEITIRPLTVEDTDLIVKWRNAPSVMRYFIDRTPLTAEIHLNWFHTRIQTGKVAQFVIERNGVPVGSVYLRDIDRTHKKAEFGIFIGEETDLGGGVGTAATRLILVYAFEDLQLNRVMLRVLADNARAIRCYEKVGFQKEGLFVEDVIFDGVPRDVVFMGIIKSKWKEQQAHV